MMNDKKVLLFFIALILIILAIVISFLHIYVHPEIFAQDSVKSQVIGIDQPDSEYYINDTFTVSGNTTLSKDDEIRVYFYLNYFIHGMKVRPDNTSRDVLAQIVPGKSGLNRWSATIDTTGFWPDEYIITAYNNNSQEINTSRIVVLIDRDESINHTQKMYICHPEEFPDIPIIKEYGNESNKIYYDEETWNAIGGAVAPYFTNNSRYWAYNGGIITGWGPDYCVGGISVCLDPEAPVNETMMDEIYSVFSESAKVQGMDEPYLIFIPVSAIHSD
jgi:hypothetical protein